MGLRRATQPLRGHVIAHIFDVRQGHTFLYVEWGQGPDHEEALSHDGRPQRARRGQSGRLAAFISTLPDEVVRSHAELSPAQLRLVFVTKARTGAFRGGGSMPPFSREALVDDDLARILGDFAL